MADKKKKGGVPSAAEDTTSPYPKMDLCQKIHALTKVHKTQLQDEVIQEIVSDLENPSLFASVQEQLDMPEKKDLSDLEQKLATKAAELAKAVEEAVENAGDMEVMDARIEVARFAAKSLSQQEALDAYQKVLDGKKISSGKKIDCLMECARVSSFYSDTAKTDEYIAKADKLANEGGGGDWDRRNRLKVYKALQRLLHRDTEGASSLLLDCIATFSCNEICSYSEFIVYTILTNLLHLPRPELKKKIIDGPEVISVSGEIPVVLNLAQALYDCDYNLYLHAMVEVEQVLLEDRYLHPHAAFWMRELHLLAYKQYLDSYQSVTLEAMSTAFGVSTDFIDHHACRFIATNHLSAKIDKYGGVIITNRPDLKNAQYREMIQKGDLLLNRIQKLARVVDL